MSITDGPERDRPQKKVLANGRAVLPDDKLLTDTGVPQNDKL